MRILRQYTRERGGIGDRCHGFLARLSRLRQCLCEAFQLVSLSAQLGSHRTGFSGGHAVIVALVTGMATGTVSAQTCTPLGVVEYHSPMSPVGVAIAPIPAYWTLPQYQADGDQEGFVPEGEVWRIEAAGALLIGEANDPPKREWTMYVETKVQTHGGVCCWYPPAQPAITSSSAAPVGLVRPIVLRAGQRIGTRATLMIGQMAVQAVGWRYPASCLAEVLRGVR